MISKTKINKPSWLNLINIDSVYSFDKQRQVFSFIGEYFRHRSHLAIADITLEQNSMLIPISLQAHPTAVLLLHIF